MAGVMKPLKKNMVTHSIPVTKMLNHNIIEINEHINNFIVTVTILISLYVLWMTSLIGTYKIGLYTYDHNLWPHLIYNLSVAYDHILLYLTFLTV